MTRHSDSDLPTAPPPDASVPAFEAVDSHDDLVAWSRAYAGRAVAATDLAVDLSLVDWDVSTRAKRRAAAVLHPRLDDTALGEPADWAARDVDRNPGDDATDTSGGPGAGDDATETSHATDGTADHGGPAGDVAATGGTDSATTAAGPPRCTVRLTWGAAEAYDRETWAETLRHELVHVEQFQHSGTTGHGSAFERRAQDLSTTVRCKRFATPKYVLTCPDCETVVARRYRDCKLVRRHEEYRSSCCEAPLALTRTGVAD